MVRLALQEMLHFIRQLQHYSHLEVIDCSWKTLEDFALRKQGDLDSLMEAHRAYLERLINKGLLRGSGAKQVSDCAELPEMEELQADEDANRYRRAMISSNKSERLSV